MDSHFIHGHRGARGVYPENTLEAFRKSYDEGVRAFELDLVIACENKVLISHEPYMNHSFCLKPNGEQITLDEEKDFNVYRMQVNEMASYDCGSKLHPLFPDQASFKTYKPFFKELDSVFSREEGATIFWNIELKSEAEFYGSHQPVPAEFVKLVLQELETIACIKAYMLQSFDINVLEELNIQSSCNVISYLIENEDSFETNMKKLSFKPHYYNPDFTLVKQELVDEVHLSNMQIIPWTVNSIEEARALIDLGVDGIISDYPQNLRLLSD